MSKLCRYKSLREKKSDTRLRWCLGIAQVWIRADLCVQSQDGSPCDAGEHPLDPKDPGWPEMGQKDGPGERRAFLDFGPWRISFWLGQTSGGPSFSHSHIHREWMATTNAWGRPPPYSQMKRSVNAGPQRFRSENHIS